MTDASSPAPAHRSEPLPARYAEDWYEPIQERVRDELSRARRILDVGSGRTPLVPRASLPRDSTYMGLDVSARELARAPAGAYDETFVADVVRRIPALESNFDLIVSWQVLEHVERLDQTLENLRCYLRPGGRLLVQFSGTFSLFGLINMAVPRRLGVWALKTLLQRQPDTVFPAYYHHCWYSAIQRAMEPWESVEIVPRYRGAGYLRFSPRLQRLYLRYEDWVEARGHRNFATHYLLDARR